MHKNLWSGLVTDISTITNPWCMREGYSSRYLCVSVTKLAATYTYFVCRSKVWFYKAPYGVSNACIVCIVWNLVHTSVICEHFCL